MTYRSRYRVALVVFLVLPSLIVLMEEGVPAVGSAYEGTIPHAPAEAWWEGSLRSCLPRYGDPQFMVRIAEDAGSYESEPTTADLNGDGWEDVVLTKVNFQSYETFALDILASDQKGGMVLATPAIFQGPVPRVQNPRQVVVADFNGDGRSDLFVADHGYDAHPFPGFQNTLVLSAPGGKLVDGTSGLPQQSDFTHSAAAADIDGDGDIDLYNGNFWGQAGIDPQILLNDGSGKFSVGKKRLPPLVSLNQNGYTTCAFSDIDNDGDLDLILGDGGDDINNEHSTPNSEVLVNDGKGVFGLLPDAMPAKDHDASDIAHDIEPVDLNGDEYLDLFIVYEKQPAQGSYIQALVNNRDGTFRNESASRLDPVDRKIWIPYLELRDLDRDGDMDLLAKHTDYQDPDPLLFLNDGQGRYRRQPLDFHLTYLYYSFLDLDQDGGQDLLMVEFPPPEDAYAIRDRGCPVFLPLICQRCPSDN